MSKLTTFQDLSNLQGPKASQHGTSSWLHILFLAKHSTAHRLLICGTYLLQLLKFAEKKRVYWSKNKKSIHKTWRRTYPTLGSSRCIPAGKDLGVVDMSETQCECNCGNVLCIGALQPKTPERKRIECAHCRRQAFERCCMAWRTSTKHGIKDEDILLKLLKNPIFLDLLTIALQCLHVGSCHSTKLWTCGVCALFVNGFLDEMCLIWWSSTLLMIQCIHFLTPCVTSEILMLLMLHCFLTMVRSAFQPKTGRETRASLENDSQVPLSMKAVCYTIRSCDDFWLPASSWCPLFSGTQGVLKIGCSLVANCDLWKEYSFELPYNYVMAGYIDLNIWTAARAQRMKSWLLPGSYWNSSTWS